MIVVIADPVVLGALVALPFVIVFAAFRKAHRQKKERQEEAEWLAWQNDRTPPNS